MFDPNCLKIQNLPSSLLSRLISWVEKSMCLVWIGHVFSCFLSKKMLLLLFLEQFWKMKSGWKWYLMCLQDNRLAYSMIILLPNDYGRNAIITESSLRIHAHPLDEILWWASMSIGIHQFCHYVQFISNEQQVVGLKFQYHQWLVEIHCYQKLESSEDQPMKSISFNFLWWNVESWWMHMNPLSINHIVPQMSNPL